MFLKRINTHIYESKKKTQRWEMNAQDGVRGQKTDGITNDANSVVEHEIILYDLGVRFTAVTRCM